MTFLLDGYNLMHAVGSVPPPKGTRTQFDSARVRFLDWLADSPALCGGGHTVRVVFDAQNSTRDFGTSTHRGLTVTYSFGQTADDLIEALISVEGNPQSVRVVSNDGRLRDFARRHRCRHLTCGEFVNWLMEPPAVDPTRGHGPDKPDQTPADEVDELLKAFGGKKRGT